MGDNFCDFLFLVSCTPNPFQKRDLLYKERVYSQEEQILSFKSRSLFKSHFGRVTTPENILIPQKDRSPFFNDAGLHLAVIRNKLRCCAAYKKDNSLSLNSANLLEHFVFGLYLGYRLKFPIHIKTAT